MTMPVRHHLAYVFERFPSFTQTFCVREILELERQGLRPLLFSIRDTRDEPLEDHFPKGLIDRVHILPPRDKLKKQIEKLKKENALPQEIVLTLRHWGSARDKARIYEAAYVGLKMREAGITHAHSHFAGIGARTCYWLKQFYKGMTYSFTGHANDIFERTEFDVGLGDLMREAACVVTVSDYTANYLRDRFPKAGGKVRRVYNGLDLEPFEKVPKREREPLRILSVGRLIEKKGFEDLIAACGHLRKMEEVPEFECLIVGDGPLEDELAARIQKLGLEECVQLAGPRSQSEIVEMLGGTAVFALACVTEKGGGKDNLPTVIMEAMAAAVPCVSTRLAGVPEMVADGETGYLADERDVDGLATAMATLLRDEGMRARMGHVGRERARALFAKEVTARLLRQVLVAGGSVRFEGALLGKDPSLFFGYLKQWVGRGLRRLQPAKKSPYALAEKAARDARKTGG